MLAPFFSRKEGIVRKPDAASVFRRTREAKCRSRSRAYERSRKVSEFCPQYAKVAVHRTATSRRTVKRSKPIALDSVAPSPHLSLRCRATSRSLRYPAHYGLEGKIPP